MSIWQKLNTDIDLTLVNRVLFRFGRARFYTELAARLNEGTPLKSALTFLADSETDWGRRPRGRKTGRYQFATACLTSLEHCGRISPAFTGWLPDDDIQLIQDGEGSGDIATALLQAAIVSHAFREMVTSLLRTLFYPALLLGFCIFNIYIASVNLLPTMRTFGSPEQWSLAMRMLAFFAQLLNHAGIIILFICGVVMVVKFSLTHWTKRAFFDRYIPPWSLYQTFQGVRFLFRLSSMLSVGIPLVKALEKLMQNSETNLWLYPRIQEIYRYCALGQSLGIAMRSSEYDFPSRQCINQLLLLNSTHDPAAMASYAEKWLEEAKKSVSRQGIVITVIIGIFVFLFIITMLLAVYGLQYMFVK